MTTVNVKFDDYVLNDVSEWSENIETRLRETSVPRRHGSYHEDTFVYGSRQITLRGTIFRADWGESRTVLTEMKQRLSEGKKRLYFDDERYIWATMSGFNLQHQAKYGQGAAVDFSIAFICKDPFWYDISSTTTQDTSVAHEDTIIVTNSGNVTTPPTFTILSTSGDASNIQITNNHSDISQFVRYGGTLLQDDETLIINCDEATMEKDNTNVLNDFTGDFFHLGVGSNSLTVIFEDATTLSITINHNNRNS